MKLPLIKDLAELIKQLKPTIGDDYRSSEFDSEDDLPSMLLTVGWSAESGEWSRQIGDNSYSGGAYFYPTWAAVAIYRRSNSKELARDIRDQLSEATYQ
jgi:hypothetical protein